MGADGTTLDQRRSPRGLMAVEGGRFSEALEEVCSDWLASRQRLPVVMSGMVGSKLGWKEAPYLGAPAALDGRARHLCPVEAQLNGAEKAPESVKCHRCPQIRRLLPPEFAADHPGHHDRQPLSAGEPVAADFLQGFREATTLDRHETARAAALVQRGAVRSHRPS